MKTNVKSISINGDYGVVVIPMQQQPGGNLKRRYLQRLLECGQVIPSEQVNQILLEVLQELNAAYGAIKEQEDEICDLLEELEDLEETELEHLGTEEEMLNDIEALKADVEDLQADMAELAREKNIVGAFTAGLMHSIADRAKD